jgi:phosphoglycerate dehydrogenase-like enzyme
MGEKRVLITCPQMQNSLERFRERIEAEGISIDSPEVVQQPTEEELLEIIGAYDGMIAGDDPLTAPVLERATRMRVISKWGVGTDGIDTEAAARLRIAVTNTPNVFGEEVADVAAGYLILLARQLHRMDASVQAGGWLKIEGRSLTGSSLGIVGLGDVGNAVARRGLGFGMDVRGHDVSAEARERAESIGVTTVGFEELLANSEFLVLCCPLTPDTRHLINERTLSLMRPGSYVVNVARGPLIDERRLLDALADGRVAGAALDVFEVEPLPLESELRKFDQCIFGTHNGSNTREAVIRASEQAVDNLLAGLR